MLDYHGLKAADLARRVGVSPAAVSQWLGEVTGVSEENGRKIAQVLGEDPDFVMCRKDSGAKGWGYIIGKLEGTLGAERMARLAELDPRELTSKIDSILDEDEPEKP